MSQVRQGTEGSGWRGEGNWRVVVVRQGIVAYSSSMCYVGFATAAPESKKYLSVEWRVCTGNAIDFASDRSSKCFFPWIARKDEMEGYQQQRSDLLLAGLDIQTSNLLLKETIYANQQNVMPQSKEADHLTTFQVSTMLRFAQG